MLCTNLLLVGAYLISQIPLPEFGLGRNDYEDLGFGLQRDLSSYSEDYYPDDEVCKCARNTVHIHTYEFSRRCLIMNTQIHFLDPLLIRRRKRLRSGRQRERSVKELDLMNLGFKRSSSGNQDCKMNFISFNDLKYILFSFERITTAVKNFLTPIYRRSFDTFGGGFEKRIKRYYEFFIKHKLQH